MKHIFLSLFGVAVTSILISSCHCACICRKEINYVIIEAKNEKNDSVFAAKTFGPFLNYSELTIMDSLQAFSNQYKSDTVRILKRDSLIHSEHLKISCNEKNRQTSMGFVCDCVK